MSGGSRRAGPRVFVSYAHDSDEHKGVVSSLCEVLRDHGIDIVFDQWVSGKNIWTEWAEGLQEAAFVLVVASPMYRARVGSGRVTDHGTGVLYEARLLRDLVMGFPDSWQRRILPVLLPGHTKEEIPAFLLPHSGTRYEVKQICAAGVAELLAALTGDVSLPAPASDAGSRSPEPRVGATAVVQLAGPPPPVTATAASWRAGDEVSIGAFRYLIHDDPTEWTSTDHSVAWRTATAARLEPDYRLVRLRQVRPLGPRNAANSRRGELRAQGRLAGTDRVDAVDEDGATTLVTALPPGRSWSELFGPCDVAPDRVTASAALASAASLCDDLARLHRAGTSHRTIGPHEILVRPGKGLVRLRDLGFAALTPSSDDRPTGQRAPEQARPPWSAGVRTDVYQLAAVVYHTLTCHPPGPVCPPVRATMPACPKELDELLLRCLDTDSAKRPADVRELRDALRSARRRVVQGEWPEAV